MKILLGENPDSNREPIVPQTILLPIEIYSPTAGPIWTVILKIKNFYELPLLYSEFFFWYKDYLYPVVKN